MASALRNRRQRLLLALPLDAVRYHGTASSILPRLKSHARATDRYSGREIWNGRYHHRRVIARADEQPCPDRESGP